MIINTKQKIKRYPFYYERETLEKLQQAIGRTNRNKDDWSITYMMDSMLNNFRCSWSYGLWHISVSCISNILFTIFRFRFSSIFLCYPLYEKHPPIRGRFFIYLSFILTHLMLMQVFFSGCKTTSDMPLLLVHIQNLSHFTCQSRIELTETVSAVLMYSALTNPEFLRRLTHRCLCINNIICNFHCPLLDIIFHG